MKSDIIDLLDEKYNSFTKSFKKISTYIKYNQNILAFVTINELAKFTDTSPATITRFAKELGFSGYPDLQSVFQKNIEYENSYMKGLRNEIFDISEKNKNILKDIIDTNIEILSSIDFISIEKKIQQAITWLNNSRKIYILGARGSYSIAYYLYFMLKEFRGDIELLISGASDFTDDLLHVKKEDILFVISFHPYSRFACDIAKYFSDNKNKIISITDKEDSVLGMLSDLVLTIKNCGKAYSFVPVIVIINAMIAKLAVENKKILSDNFDRLKEITDRFNIYSDK